MKTAIRKPRGFTLIELLVTLSIAAILATLAVPGFLEFFRNNRLNTQASDLVSSINLARSEAIRRGVRVTLCKSDTSATTPTCTTSGDWSQGWIVFTDSADGTTFGTINGSDVRIRVIPPISNTGSTLGGGTNFGNWISLLPSGLSRGNGGLANGTYTLCNSGVSRLLAVNTAGRVTISTGAC